ncbi:glycosyltransferase family 2 protein [Danxiaibacter flavus]|uniref:Glycosyltransferase family 2 protein n=1 Tax=Danxiaibacter flavus TaxID=3049108 RepID=A0ABV3ZGZ3_9BACT|nr:glycosyltransferase family 2 protein [Chitinophagaceae bacterium DXS]
MSNLVSIVTPIYNAELYLKETIESVINQTFTNWELLLVDDCSSDNGVTVAKMFAERDSRIKVLLMPRNGGAAAARNMAIKNASGKYIAFLDSDDTWSKTKLAIQLDFMQKENVSFCFSSYNVVNENGEFLKQIKVRNTINYRGLLNGCSIGCLTVVYDVERFGKLYFLDSENTDTSVAPAILKRWGKEDYVLWLTIARMLHSTSDDVMAGVSLPLANYRKRTGGISSNKLNAAKYQWLVYRQIEKLNPLTSLYHFLCYFVHGLKKHFF